MNPPRTLDPRLNRRYFLGASLAAAAPGADSRKPIPGEAPGARKDGIELYPESLRPFLRDSRHVCFAGTQAGAPGVTGTVRVIDVTGQTSRFTEQDLLILRLTPDLLDRLPERLATLIRTCPC